LLETPHGLVLQNIPVQKGNAMKISSLRLAGICLLFLAINTSATVRYVDLNSTNATPPYDAWNIAATNIQDAIDAALDGEQILVTNGVYATGGRVVFGLMTNRVVINKAVTVQSVNGAAATLIQGIRPIGNSAVRCVYLTNNATLIGFTLTNGATRSTGNANNEESGGGAWCLSATSKLINCLVVSNYALMNGGGVYLGTCINCRLSQNHAGSFGGGAYSAFLDGCILASNSASYGGGADTVVLNSCSLIGNTANEGGGVQAGTLTNCIIYYNTAAFGVGINSQANPVDHCCTIPLPSSGTGNFTNAPLFADLAGGDYHLQSNSPCINAGKNSSATTNDLDGNPRIVGGTVDMGAYEFQSPSSILSYVWAQQYGLPTDGSADFTDTDSDGLNNWQEWIAGTIPTNSLSVLKMFSPSNNAPDLKVSWQSVSGRTYFLQRAIDLTAQPAFSVLQSNIVGQAGTTTYSDTTATNGGPYFYRVGVQ
jgi:hypothetical protein